jgi:diguanylate cyclase (GGDEF)-like protein
VVEPAKRAVRELEDHSARAMGLMAWIVVLGAVAAEGLARALVMQFPDPQPLAEREGSSAASADAPPLSGPVASSAQHPLPWLRDLQPLMLSLARSEDALAKTREEMRRSEQQRRRLEAEVSTLSIVDPISGCANRRQFYRRLDHEMRRSERDKSALSFLCLEIDHLREIRESYGASMGDAVLRAVAGELRSRLRTTDFLCRFGELQFGVLLPSCDATSANRVAELLCASVTQLEIEQEDCRLSVSLSVGVTALRSGSDDGESLITRAGNALYRAKAEGRNRAVVH